MASIITPRKRVHVTEYALEFGVKGDLRFGFPCDEQGNIHLDKLTQAARLNLAKCLAGAGGLTSMGVCDQSYDYSEPALLRCDCGHYLHLEDYTNSCPECGREYDLSGQLLAPRHFWGEETGETLADIEAGDYDPEEIRVH